jgi:hypothetical protein
MSELQGGISKKSPTTELDIIKQKRAALQKLIQLTSTLNRLHQGLQSVILMGKSVAQIPEKIINKFKTLSEGLKSKPTDTLKNTLTSTDQKIQRDIKHVLEISQKSDALLEKQLGATGNKLVDVLKEDYHEYVNDFKKKSQTSITLRIALKTRKTVVKAFNLPVPESFIEQQIVSLNHKEKVCRKAVKNDMASLQGDVDTLMNRNDCPDDIKQILTEIKSDLKVNVDHFDSGKAIDEMPIMYESIELSGAPQVVEEVEEEIKPAAEDPTKVEPEIIQSKKIKKGFFGHLWTWLNSPWKKSWKDTK